MFLANQQIYSLRQATYHYLQSQYMPNFQNDPNQQKEGLLNILYALDTKLLARMDSYSQFNRNVVRQLETQFPKMKSMRSDGNGYYRGVAYLYIQRLIVKGPEYILDFIRNVVDFQHYFVPSRKERKIFQENYRAHLVGYLSQIYCKFCKKAPTKDVLEMFSHMMQKCDEFDRGLVFYLRVSLAQFLTNNNEITIHGLPVSFIYDNTKYNSISDYVERVVLQMDAEAEDLAFCCMPIVLRIPIMIILVRKDEDGGLNQRVYSAVLNGYQKWQSDQDALNFHREKPLPLLHQPFHY